MLIPSTQTAGFPKTSKMKASIPHGITAAPISPDRLTIRFSGTPKANNRVNLPWYKSSVVKLGVGGVLVASGVALKLLGLASVLAAPVLVPLAVSGILIGAGLLLWGAIQAFSSKNQPAKPEESPEPSSSAPSRPTQSSAFDPMMHALTKLEQAVNQNNPQATLEAQIEIMRVLKGWIDQVGSNEDKQKAKKAELSYHHYEQYIDGLDLTAPKLTFADLPDETRQHLHAFLYHALTSIVPELVSFAEDYSKKLGIDESFIQALIKDGGATLPKPHSNTPPRFEQQQINNNPNGNGN